MSTLVLRTAGSTPLFGRTVSDSQAAAMSRSGGDEPCGGERVIDFAICLVIAAAVVGLLLLAL